MFRALNHEGIAAECLFELLVSDERGRRMTLDARVRAFTACALLAKAAHGLIGCGTYAAQGRHG